MDFQETENNYDFYSLKEGNSSLQVDGYLEEEVGAVAHLQTPANGIPEQGEHPQSKAETGAKLPWLKAESSSDYYRAIAGLNSEWRLILCKDGIQWVLQKRRPGRWEGKWFARTKQGLIRGILDLVSKGELFGDDAWQAVNSLPTWAHEMAAAWEPSPLREAILARAKGEVVHAN